MWRHPHISTCRTLHLHAFRACRAVCTAVKPTNVFTFQPVPSLDRVLRYPDGLERTIRYPAPSALSQAEQRVEQDSYDTDADTPGWVICGDHDAGCMVADDGDSTLPGAAPVGALWGDERQASAAALRTDHDVAAHPASISDAAPQSSRLGTGAGALPNSPAELLRLLQSADYQRQRQEEAAHVSDSFTLLTECPWAVPRQLSVIALRRRGQEHPAMYTLPASLQKVRLLPVCAIHSVAAQA